MFDIFSKGANRIKIKEENIFIDNQNNNREKAIENNYVFELKQPSPEIKIFENDSFLRSFKIEPLNTNPDLIGQYLHSSIRILANGAVMIDGIISNNQKTVPEWNENKYEGIRFQPFYLSDKNEYNLQLVGKGLFERGLHFVGTVTPMSVRNICICDSCNKSFTIQHFHAGFSDAQYFYSSDSRETLIVPYHAIEGLPTQLQNDINPALLEKVEEKLPRPSNDVGSFRYYNSFKCPYCSVPFIDFENNQQIRPKEYYGNTYVNVKPKYWIDEC